MCSGEECPPPAISLEARTAPSISFSFSHKDGRGTRWIEGLTSDERLSFLPVLPGNTYVTPIYVLPGGTYVTTILTSYGDERMSPSRHSALLLGGAFLALASVPAGGTYATAVCPHSPWRCSERCHS